MNQNEYIELCNGLEEMAEKYKNLQTSDLVRDGKRVQDYKGLLKKGRIWTLLKRLLRHNNEVDTYIQDTWELPYYPNDYRADKKIAVYTALFGKYDNLPEPIICPNNIEYYVFTDGEVSEGSKWNKIDITPFEDKIGSLNNAEKNRFFKILPHKVFQNYEYSIYVDANVLIVSDLTPMIKTLDTFPIAMFLHKNRDCVYEEAKACIIKGKDSPERIKKHIFLLEQHDVPHHYGLLEATLIVRKHNEDKCQKLMQCWWEEFLEESKRDQLSLIDTLWNNKIPVETIGVLGNNLLKCNKFIVLPHN